MSLLAALPMDAVEPFAQQLAAASSWDGHAHPDDVALVLSLLLPLLPLDARACAACVCRAWRAAAAAPALWTELSFERCAARVTDAVLASVCARAGAALRTLRLDSDACTRVTGAGMVAALRGGGCADVHLLKAPLPDARVPFHPTLRLPEARVPRKQTWLTAEQVQHLAAACPTLQHAACAVRCRLSDAAAVATALPGPLMLECNGNDDADVTQLAECLRVNATLTSLDLWGCCIGVAGATQLAECLRLNSALTSLDLRGSRIGDVGATQLADCLRVNATLTSLNLRGNSIGDVGATQLADGLRVNAKLTSLNLQRNSIVEAGAIQLADCLRVNTTLTSLNVDNNFINDAGATQLVECLSTNTTLTSLDLGHNYISETGMERLAGCPRVRGGGSTHGL